MNYLTAEKKLEFFTEYGKSNIDTGSPEGQIALFSYRISHLTEHLNKPNMTLAEVQELQKIKVST